MAEEGAREKVKSAQHRRMEIIETVLRTEGKVRTADLAERFGIGQNLLANDLKRLEELGLIVRGHGWVMRRTTEIEDLFAGTDYAARKARNIEEKKAIAKYIVDQLEDSTQVLMDAGSTALAVGMRLVEKERSVDVLTNSLPLLLHLARYSSLSCYIVAGDYSRDQAAIVGEDAAKFIEEQKFDAAVLTPRALSLVDPRTVQAIEPTGLAVQRALKRLADDRGEELEEVAERSLYFNLYSMDPSQHPYKSTLIKNATKLFIALDHTKFSPSGRNFFTLILTELISERPGAEFWKEIREEMERPSLLPVRTRGAVRLRRTMAELRELKGAEVEGEEEKPKEGEEKKEVSDIDVEDPVDLREPESIEIVTTTEDGENPPMELVRQLQLLREGPWVEQLIGMLKRVLVVVDRDGQPISSDWIEYVLG